jgi:hypothetical protein
MLLGSRDQTLSSGRSSGATGVKRTKRAIRTASGQARYHWMRERLERLRTLIYKQME